MLLGSVHTRLCRISKAEQALKQHKLSSFKQFKHDDYKPQNHLDYTKYLIIRYFLCHYPEIQLRKQHHIQGELYKSFSPQKRHSFLRFLNSQYRVELLDFEMLQFLRFQRHFGMVLLRASTIVQTYETSTTVQKKHHLKSWQSRVFLRSW